MTQRVIDLVQHRRDVHGRRGQATKREVRIRTRGRRRLDPRRNQIPGVTKPEQIQDLEHPCKAPSRSGMDTSSPRTTSSGPPTPRAIRSTTAPTESSTRTRSSSRRSSGRALRLPRLPPNGQWASRRVQGDPCSRNRKSTPHSRSRIPLARRG